MLRSMLFLQNYAKDLLLWVCFPNTSFLSLPINFIFLELPCLVEEITSIAASSDSSVDVCEEKECSESKSTKLEVFSSMPESAYSIMCSFGFSSDSGLELLLRSFAADFCL